MKLWLGIVFGVMVLGLTACQPNNADAGKAVEQYLQARVAGEVDTMINLSCPAWEAQARIEAATFKALQAQLDGVACTASGTEGEFSLVNCTGKIVTTYQGENKSWDMAEKPFKVVNDGGEWRMCGYK